MRKTILLAITLVLIAISGKAQAPDYVADGGLLDGKTIVKADLMGLTVRNFGFSAERIINKNLSVNLGVRFMPTGGIPLLSTIEQFVNTAGSEAGTTAESYLKDVRINSLALTPELRIYAGKGYGRGFYFAPYYNFFRFNLEDLTLEEEIDGKTETAVLSGGITTHSGGIMLGYQWLIGPKKNIVIDWGIFGIHAGTSSGHLTGKISRELSPEDQAEMKKSIDESLSGVPLFKFESKVGPNTVIVDEKGPWAFFRGSLSVGFRF